MPVAAGSAAGWVLAVDFGTSYTAAAVRTVGSPTSRSVRLGSGSDVMPSGVFVDDGMPLVGDEARGRAAAAPDCYVREPKRWFGHEDEVVFAGGVIVDDRDMVAAVLRHVLVRARSEHSGSAPAVVRVTHPVEWATERLTRLRDAAVIAGYGDVLELLPEPVAAATQLLDLRAVPVGAFVGVYDFGGGTFDACVLQRTAAGFDVRSRRGHEALGGNHIDDRLVDHVREVCEERGTPLPEPEPDDPGAEDVDEAFGRLRDNVRLAKETAVPGRRQVVRLRAPMPRQEVEFTGELIDALVADDVATTVAIFGSTVADAGLVVADLHTVHAIGGSSRLRLVGSSLRSLLPDGVLQTVGDPKTVVAVGAAGLPTQAERPAAPPPPAPAPVPLETAVAVQVGPTAVPATPAPVSADPDGPADWADLALSTGAQPAYDDGLLFVGGVLENEPTAAGVDVRTGEVRWGVRLPEEPNTLRARGGWVVAQGATTVTVISRDGQLGQTWSYHFVQQVLLGDGVLWIRSAAGAPQVKGSGRRRQLAVPLNVTRIGLEDGRVDSCAAGYDLLQGELSLPTGVFHPQTYEGRSVLSVGATVGMRLLGGLDVGMLEVDATPVALAGQAWSLGTRPWTTAVASGGGRTVRVTPTEVTLHAASSVTARQPLAEGWTATAWATRHGLLLLVTDSSSLRLLEPTPAGALREIGRVDGSLVGETPNVYTGIPATVTMPHVVEGPGSCWLPVLAPDGSSTTFCQVLRSPKSAPRELGRRHVVPGLAVPVGCPDATQLIYLDLSGDGGVVRTAALERTARRRSRS